MRAHGQNRFIEAGALSASDRGSPAERVALAIDLFRAMIALRLGRDVATRAARAFAYGRGAK